MWIFSLLFPFLIFAEAFYFTPPPNWEIVRSQNASSQMEVGFIEPKTSSSRASIHLALEETDSSLQDYVRAVKSLLAAQAETKSWRDLGNFTMQAGQGRLTELVTTSPSGDMKMLQAIFVKAPYAFVLTAAAPARDFSKHRKTMVHSLKTLTFVSNLFEAVPEQEDRDLLKEIFSLIEPSKKEGKKKEIWQRLLSETENLSRNLGRHWQYLILKEGYQQIYDSGF